MSPHYDLDLEHSKTMFSHDALAHGDLSQLDNTKFGSKGFTRSADIVSTVNEVSNTHCDPDLEHSNKRKNL